MKKNLLLLGVNGMLGHTLFKYFYYSNKLNTYGLLRNKKKLLKWKIIHTAIKKIKIKLCIGRSTIKKIKGKKENFTYWKPNPKNLNIFTQCVIITKK